MKRLLAMLLALVMLLCCANAEHTKASEVESLPEVLNVVNNTKVTGAFFTDLWSSNTSDIDVRNMIHGLSTVAWVDDLSYDFDNVVVANHSFQDNEDGSRTYIITIRRGLKYSDGSAITAADYVFSILLQAGPQLKALGAAETAYTFLKGYEAYHNGETNEFEGVRLFGEYTFGLTVDSAYLPFFYENTYADVTPYPINAIAPNCFVVDSANGAYVRCEVSSITSIDSNGNSTVSDYSYNTELLEKSLLSETGYVSSPTVVSGPYTMVSWDAQSGMVSFEINPYYPRDEYAKLYEKNMDGNEYIRYVTLNYASAADAIEGMKNGTYQLYNKAVAASIIEDGIAAGVNYTPYGRRGMGYIVFACEGVLENAELRRAVTCMCDRERFIADYLGSFGQAVYGYYGIGQWMTQAALGVINPDNFTPEEQAQWDSVTLDALNVYSYDTDRAQQLLAAAGYTSDAPLALSFAIPAGSGAARVIADMLTAECETLPVSIEVTEMDFTEMVTEMTSEGRAYDMYFIGNNFEAVFDPTAAFSVADDSASFSRIKDEELCALAMRMRETEADDALTYYLNWFEFQKRIADVVPVLPIYSDVYADFCGAALQNYDIISGQGWAQGILFAYFGYADGAAGEKGVFIQ